MGMPAETTNEDQPETAAALANENVLIVVALPGVEEGFAVIKSKLANLKKASVANFMASIADAENTVTTIEQQIIGAAIEAVKHADEKVEITGDAPAIIVRRSIGEAISRGDLRPGQKLPGKDIILVTAWEPINRAGQKLGRKLASFGAPENLPGEPQSFNRNVAKIADLRDWHGYNGWTFDRQRSGTSSYEDGRFKGYQDGSAVGTWGAPELPILNGSDRDGKPVAPAENMLVLSRDEKSAFKHFVTSGSDGAEWSQSCTESRVNPGSVLTVLFPDGNVGWDRKDGNRSCVRPVVALELNHLIL
ncbi:MAG: hypothetical protein JWQ87_4831 [Candidatus Sulfotelmatobacter sp.]|nr:hypothetical protein [Candidatus Sulfotelmatobacter sp.]